MAVPTPRLVVMVPSVTTGVISQMAPVRPSSQRGSRWRACRPGDRHGPELWARRRWQPAFCPWRCALSEAPTADRRLSGSGAGHAAGQNQKICVCEIRIHKQAVCGNDDAVASGYFLFIANRYQGSLPLRPGAADSAGVSASILLESFCQKYTYFLHFSDSFRFLSQSFVFFAYYSKFPLNFPYLCATVLL